MGGRIATVPNLLSFFRMALIPIFVMVTVADHFTLSLVIFVSAAVTDAVDGYLARRLNQRSPLGAILDPAADKLLMVSGYVVYTIHEHAPYPIPSWLTFTVFVRDLLIVIFAYLLYTRVRIDRFPPTVTGKASTILQVVTLSFVIAANTPIRFAVEPFVRPLFWATIALTLISGWQYMRRADRQLHALRAEVV